MTTYPHGYAPGQRIHFSEDPDTVWHVAACDARYIIATANVHIPYDEEDCEPARDTWAYAICDLKLDVRGPDNMILGSSYETYGDCEERLKELQAGEIEVSRRNHRYVRLDIVPG